MPKLTELVKIVSVPVVLASLCCLSPLVLVLFGVSTLSFASSLSDTLYGQYKWGFRVVGLLTLLGSLIFYLRTQKGICTLDQAKRRKNEIINYLLITLILGVLGYIIFLYVIVHYAGVWLQIWSDY